MFVGGGAGKVAGGSDWRLGRFRCAGSGRFGCGRAGRLGFGRIRGLVFCDFIGNDPVLGDAGRSAFLGCHEIVGFFHWNHSEFIISYAVCLWRLCCVG